MSAAVHRCEGCDHTTEDPRAYAGAPCPYCGEPLARLAVLADGAGETPTVEVPRNVAALARRELERLIETTGGPDGFEVGQHERLAVTPLALVRRELEDKKARAEDAGDEYAADVLGNALSVVRDVGDLTGEETAPTDPLTDEHFRAFYTLNGLLDRARPWGANATRMSD